MKSRVTNPWKHAGVGVGAGCGGKDTYRRCFCTSTHALQVLFCLSTLHTTHLVLTVLHTTHLVLTAFLPAVCLIFPGSLPTLLFSPSLHLLHLVLVEKIWRWGVTRCWHGNGIMEGNSGWTAWCHIAGLEVQSPVEHLCVNKCIMHWMIFMTRPWITDTESSYSCDVPLPNWLKGLFCCFVLSMNLCQVLVYFTNLWCGLKEGFFLNQMMSKSISDHFSVRWCLRTF